MLTSRKLAGAGLGAALALSLVSPPAFAVATTAATATYNGAATGFSVQYATQAVSSGSTIVTAPFSTVFLSGVLASSIASQTSNVTFTLPGSLTFASIPTPSCTVSGTTPTCTAVQLSGVGGAVVGASSVTVQFTYSTPAGCVTCVIQPAIGQFTFNNAGVLSTATTAPLKITASTTDANLLAAAEKPTAEFASSASSLTFSAANTANLPAIDIVTTGVLGKKFLQNGVSTTTADAGILTITLGAQKGIDGLVAFTFGGAAGTVTISGNFNNIASAFLAKGGNADCTVATTPVSTVTGPFAGSIVFTGVTVPVASSTTHLCLVANGTGVIAANETAPTASITVSATTQSATATVVGSTLLLDIYKYNGGVTNIQYSGLQAGYQSFIRIVNNSSAVVTVTGVFQSDGGIVTTTTIAFVEAGGNALVAVADILAAAGAEESGRVSLLALSPSESVLVSQLLLNPDGTVVNIQ